MMGYRAFEQHKAIMLHLGQSPYDYFKYNGKTKVTLDTFNKSPLKYAFYNFEKNNPIDVERACYFWWLYVHHKGSYHKVPFLPKFVKQYQVWKESLVKNLENDLEIVDIEQAYSIINIWPKLIEQYDKKQVSMYTVLMFDMYHKPFINSIVVNDPVRWPKLKDELTKHRGFLSYVINIQNIQNDIQNSFTKYS